MNTQCNICCNIASYCWVCWVNTKPNAKSLCIKSDSYVSTFSPSARFFSRPMLVGEFMKLIEWITSFLEEHLDFEKHFLFT